MLVELHERPDRQAGKETGRGKGQGQGQGQADRISPKLYGLMMKVSFPSVQGEAKAQFNKDSYKCTFSQVQTAHAKVRIVKLEFHKIPV